MGYGFVQKKSDNLPKIKTLSVLAQMLLEGNAKYQKGRVKQSVNKVTLNAP